jgi:hypothetical protein
LVKSPSSRRSIRPINDALAARVPSLAGLIHLTPDLFIDPDVDADFCHQCNGRIAAFVAQAAADEYQMTEQQSLVHQDLSRASRWAGFTSQSGLLCRSSESPLGAQSGIAV